MRCLSKRNGNQLLLSRLIIVLTTFAFVSGCGQNPSEKYKYDTALATVNSMWKAVENKDVAGVLNAVTESYLMQFWQTTDREAAKRMIEDAFNQASLPPRSANVYEITDKYEQDGLIRIEYKLKESHVEQNKPVRAISAYLLQKVGSYWQIYGSDSNLTGQVWENTDPGNRFKIKT